MTEVRFPRDILSGTKTTRSCMANLAKDLTLADAMASDHGQATPYAALTPRLLAKACADGHADTDFAWLFPHFPDLADEGAS